MMLLKVFVYYAWQTWKSVYQETEESIHSIENNVSNNAV